ncbi:MAG: nucleoside-diphosphate kinase [Ignavibacteria bacterium]|nr:nucleoside-diphosphate kinase [Bacteroidota bacterium]MSQ46365.1 nucleoside-diphosphate kinase [Ignavibacteria bacterium]
MERTLCIMKPDCVRKNLQGEVLSRLQKAGFKVLGLKQIRLTKEEAGAFYEVHKGRPFYDGLVEFMTSGSCVPVALEKENAISDYRTLIGATDPKDAADGTIRRLFADNKGENIVHGSDSVENGKHEVNFFFAESELI